MLAIIIPFYKLTFFEATLQSLADQTDKRFKVYIGDDASPEDCALLLQKFQGYFVFEYHRFKKNLGGRSLTQQWERCISLSNDEAWLMILGDDDVLGGNVVEEFYKNKREITTVCRYSTIVIDENNIPISNKFSHPKQEKASDSFFRKFRNETRSSLSEYIFKRESYEKFKFSDFPLAWYSDDMAWIKFSGNSPIITFNDAVVYFRFSNENISGKKDNIRFKENAKFLFFQKLVKEDLFRFNANQACIILTTYEVLLRNNNKLKLFDIVFLSYSYLKICKIIHWLRFLKRQLKKMVVINLKKW